MFSWFFALRKQNKSRAFVPFLQQQKKIFFPNFPNQTTTCYMLLQFL